MSMKISQLAVSFKRHRAAVSSRGETEGDVMKEEKHGERKYVFIKRKKAAIKE